MSSLEQQFRLADIEVNQSTLDEKIVGIFRYESDSRTKRGPIFLLLVEIASTAYVYEQFLDVLNAAAEQARHLIVGFGTDPMARFEKVIQKINEAAAEFIEQSPTPITWNRVSVFALELSEAHLCFTGTGRLMNLFLQKQEDGSFRAFDLFGSLEQTAEPDPKKLFTSLVCGDIKPGDVLIAGTSNFDRLRGELRLIDRLSTLPPVTAALEIKQDVEHRDIPDDFAAVIVASVELPRQVVEPVLPATKTPEKSTQSIQKLQQNQDETEALLAPTITPLSKTGDADEDGASMGPGWKARAFGIMRGGIERMREMRKRRPSPAIKDPVTLASLRGMNAGHGSFMTRKRKLILIGAGLLIVAALVGTLWYRHAKQAAAEQTLWNATYDQIVDRKNRAEADLVYNNEAHARGLVTEAQTLLGQLDEKTPSRKQSKENLIRGITDLQTKLKRETRIDHPAELLALPINTPEQSLVTLSFFKDSLYTVDRNGQAVVQINPTTKEIKRIGLSANQSQITAASSGNASLILFAPTGTLLSVDPIAAKVTSISFAINKATDIKALAYYNKRLYAIDTTQNMIWRYPSSGGGFGPEGAYLKQTNTTLADGVGLAIDSNVYVAFKNGKIVRYLSGVEEVWTPNAIDAPLQSAGSIWTTPDTDRIVITDPLGKRVIVYRKDGQLVAQILSGDFKNPTAVSGDAVAKKIYVVDGNRVLALDLP